DDLVTGVQTCALPISPCSVADDSFQTFTVLSSPPETRRPPSALIATAHAAALCALKVSVAAAPASSQTRTVPSAPDETSRLPSADRKSVVEGRGVACG